MKRQILITLNVPDDMKGIEPWGPEACLYDFVSHWLEEGYYVQDHFVELPSGIEYEGFELLSLEGDQDDRTR